MLKQLLSAALSLSLLSSLTAAMAVMPEDWRDAVDEEQTEIVANGEIPVAETLGPPISFSRFSDVPSGYWAFDEIKEIAADGVMKGTTETTFNPEGPVSLIQFIVIFTRIFYADELAASEASGEWYAANLDAANQANLLEDIDLSDLRAPVTYDQMVKVISRYADSIADYASDAIPEDFVKYFNEIFYMEFEHDNGYFSDGNGLTRAEFAVLYSKAKKVLTAEEGNETEAVAGMVFTISDSENKSIGTYTTDESGQIYVEDLTPGQYQVKEVSAPEGYTLDAKVYQVEVADGTIMINVTVDPNAEVAISIGVASTDIIEDEAQEPEDVEAVEKIDGATDELDEAQSIDEEEILEDILAAIEY